MNEIVKTVNNIIIIVVSVMSFFVIVLPPMLVVELEALTSLDNAKLERVTGSSLNCALLLKILHNIQ